MGSWVAFLRFYFHRKCLRLDQTSLLSIISVSSANCRLDGMACGSVNTVSKNGKYWVASMMANIFFFVVWRFLVCRRMQCGSFFSNWNISTIVLFKKTSRELSPCRWQRYYTLCSRMTSKIWFWALWYSWDRITWPNTIVSSFLFMSTLWILECGLICWIKEC